VGIQGLFRQSGNSSRLRKLRAAFDSGEIVRSCGGGSTHTLSESTAKGTSGEQVTPLDDCQRDPHALAGTIKAYLRDLPDTLTTQRLFVEWVRACE
jgi:hypothetical protein